jgi:O-methyltransferase
MERACRSRVICPAFVARELGSAVATLNELQRGGANGSFDLIFIDANKDYYDRYCEAAVRLARPGGLIILDNTLSRGRVADPQDHGPEATTLRRLNVKIAHDARADRVMLAIGDGMTLVRRR